MATKSDINAEIMQLCGQDYDDDTLSGRRNLHIEELSIVRDKLKELKHKLKEEQEKQQEKDEEIVRLKQENRQLRSTPGVAYH